MQVEGFTKPAQAPVERSARTLERRGSTLRFRQEQRPEVPNRAWRRRQIALAPRNVRVLIREHKRWPKLHWLSLAKWLTPEELKQSPEALAHARRQIKNTCKTLRRKCSSC